MLNLNYVKEVAKIIYKIDCICREDFKKRKIVSERDYVSILLNFMRYPFGPFVNFPFVHSQTLQGKLEQKYGCDGIIIFKYGNSYKIGMFEAKIIKNFWDSYIKKTGQSRFQSQIDRQKGIIPEITVWEIFFNSDKSNSTLDSKGSTCVKSDIAFSYSKSYIRWTYKDLFKLLKDSFSSNSNRPLNLEQIIEEMFSRNIGKEIIYSEEGCALYKDNKDIKIPLLKGEFNPYAEDKIDKFLRENKIFSYTHFDLDEFEKFKTNNPLYDVETPRLIIDKVVGADETF